MISEHLWVPEHSASHKWAAIEYATFDEALEATSEMNGHVSCEYHTHHVIALK